MACARSMDELTLLAAVLSAMTNKEIETTREYDNRIKQATAGAITGVKLCVDPKTGLSDRTKIYAVQVVISCRDGREISLTIASDQDTIQKMEHRIQEKIGVDKCLSFQGMSLDDKYLDPKWDYDFTDIEDGDEEFKRGGHRYSRPCGWKRIAIKVSGKYPDGDAWLGHTGSTGEWAVSYHGTSKDQFNKICDKGYMDGPRSMFGSGIYSSPHIRVAEQYSTEFYYNGIRYRGVIQNRVNPQDISIPDAQPDYWVCRKKEHIRPYGLCVKKV